MWDPVFAARPTSYVSVFRRSWPWWPVSDRPNVIAISGIGQIGPLLGRLPNLKAIFYPASNGVNLQTIRHNDYVHIFIGHGDSNKASSANKALKVYDEIWVAGQAHVDRFDKVAGDYSAIAFRKVGQPWMTDWLNKLPNFEIDERKSWGYFPTWRGYHSNTNYSSIDKFKDIVNSIGECCEPDMTGYVKLHPWSTSDEMHQVKAAVNHSSDNATDGREDEDQSTKVQKFNIEFLETTNQLRDVLERPLRFIICDVSGALTECLYVNVPIFLYKPGGHASLAADFDEQNAFCYIFETPQEFKTLLKRVIVDGDDYLYDQRQAALNHFVDIEHTRTGHFYNELDRLSEAPMVSPSCS